jgi:hypothetical protein
MAQTRHCQRSKSKKHSQRKNAAKTKISVRYSQRNHATKFGGSAALIKYLSEVLHFRERFSSVTIKKGKNSQFTTIDMLFGLLGMLMLGCDRIFHINDRFGDDELFAKQLGLVRIFDQSTANRFLRKFKKWHINQLDRILQLMIQMHGLSVGIACRVLDIDASDLTRSAHKSKGAKPGRNKKHKGKDSYLISCGFAAHQVVATDFRSGNAHCSQVLATIFENALRTLRRIDLVRLDAGYISTSTLTWLLAQTVSTTSEELIKFLVACNGQAKGIQWAKSYAHKHPDLWTQYKKGSDDIFLMNFNQVQLFDKYEEGIVRVVLVKMTQRVKKCKQNKVRYHTKTRIYAIATNLTHGYGARQIFKKYQQRQTIELMFRELKNAFTVGKLPSNALYANYAYFLLCCLAYNASYYFKRDVVPTQHKNSSMATIRRKFLEIPANRLDVWEVEFNRNYQYIKEYEHIVQHVHMLINDVNHATAAA